MPLFLSTSLMVLVLAPMPNKPSFQPKLPITKVLVPTMCGEYNFSLKFTEVHPAVSLIVPYKLLPFNEIIIKCASFFLHLLHLIHLFIAHFSWACMNPTTNTLFVHTPVSSHFFNNFNETGILLCMLYL